MCVVSDNWHTEHLALLLPISHRLSLYQNFCNDLSLITLDINAIICPARLLKLSIECVVILVAKAFVTLDFICWFK